MVPPEVSAVSARAFARPQPAVAPRRDAGSRRGCRGAVVKPSASIRTTAVEVLARQCRVRPGAAHQREQLVLAVLAAGDLGDDLLRQHVERRGRHAQRIEFAAAHAVEQGGAFDQFVARLRKQARLRRAADGVAGAAGALQEGRDRARRAELADQVHVADVEPEFQRRGRHQHLQVAPLEPLFRVQPGFAREAAVVRRHGVPAQQFAQGGAPPVPPCGGC